MKKIIFFAVMAVLCLNFWASGQNIVNLPQALRIGEKLPKAIWEVPMAFYKKGQYSTERLSQYKGKIILFDFWASWCTNCIDAFPKVKKLQETFGKSVQVILVNSTGSGETNAKIEHTYQLNHEVLKDLPTLINDSLIKKLIPRAVLPSYAFINSEGQLCAITTAEMVNEENIQGLINRRLELADMRKKSRAAKNKEGN